MTKPDAHEWEFRARFRRNSFGWKSRPAISRIKQAVSEIKKVARKNGVLSAEGAVLLLEKVAPALEQVDSSSGAIGTAVDNAIAELVPIIARAAADERTRDAWLERLWEACKADKMPYIEALGRRWGEVCASKDVASDWADRLMDRSREALTPSPGRWKFFEGTTNCLSALLAAERYPDVLELLGLQREPIWAYRVFGVRALAAMGRKAEAIRLAEENRSLNDNPIKIARACEEVLLSSGLSEEAYRRYGVLANRGRTYLAWFRAVAKKYPHKEPADILSDLVHLSPGEEGKWFAAAKSAKLFDEAIILANSSPCSPKTLTRAARDFAAKNPGFALEAGMAALRWIVEGYGYQITGLDVYDAHTQTMKAAENLGRAEATRRRIHALVSGGAPGAEFVRRVLDWP